MCVTLFFGVQILVLLLVIKCFNVLSIVCGGSVFVFNLVYITFILSNFAIILEMKRELGALCLLSYRCLITVNAMWLFLTVPWVGLQCVFVLLIYS